MADDIATLKERAKSFAEGFARESGLNLTARVASEEAEGLVIAFDGPDSRLLVGRHGQGLDALQFLTLMVIHRRSSSGGGSGGPRLRVIYDADNYRKKREDTLKSLAAELAEQVRATGQEAVLDPLSPMERRIVHTALVDEPGIRTYSEGEDPDRYVIISPAAEE